MELQATCRVEGDIRSRGSSSMKGGRWTDNSTWVEGKAEKSVKGPSETWGETVRELPPEAGHRVRLDLIA